MERLLADAEKLTGVEYNIDNLGDVYEAIHVIQGELGLTGVAAAEASETFSGSFNAMKAAVQNFLGSLALGEGVSESLNTLMTSASTFFFGNFLPMLGTIIKQLPGAIFTFLKQGIPILLGNISSLISDFGASLGDLANNITGEKVQTWITTTLPKLLSAAGQMLGQFAKGLITNLPKIVAAIGRIGLAIVTGLGSALWAKVKSAALNIVKFFMQPLQTLIGKVKNIIHKIKSFFPFSIGKIMSNIKLPHFSLTGKFSLKDMTVPKLSINWYAKGGIVDGATLIGAGEKGPEAIVPLNAFWRRLEKMAASPGDNVTINVYASSGMDVNALAEAVEQRIIQMQKRRTLAWQ